MAPAALAIAGGVALAVALLVALAAVWVATKAIHRRERTRENYRAAVADSISLSLASPTRIARGLTNVELDGVAPVEVVDDSLRMSPSSSPGKQLDDDEFDSFYTAQDKSYALEPMPFSRKSAPRTPSFTLTGSTIDTAPSCTGRTSTSSEDDAYDDEEDGESVHSPHRRTHSRKDRPTSATPRACPVCLDDILPGQRRRTIRACGHTFHSRCLRVWLRRDDTCPLCRVRLASAPPPLDGIEVIQRHQLALRRASSAIAPSTATSTSLSPPLPPPPPPPSAAPAVSSRRLQRNLHPAAEPPPQREQPEQQQHPPMSPLSPALEDSPPSWPGRDSPENNSQRLAQMIVSGAGYESSLDYREAAPSRRHACSLYGSSGDMFLDVDAPLRRQSTMGTIRGALRRITSSAGEVSNDRPMVEDDAQPSVSGGGLIVHVGADLSYDERV